MWSELSGPWVKCALISDCIEPVGAQSSGCRMDKKPPFRSVKNVVSSHLECNSIDILGKALNLSLIMLGVLSHV